MQSYIEGIVVKFHDYSTKKIKFDMTNGVNMILQVIFCDFSCFSSNFPKVDWVG